MVPVCACGACGVKSMEVTKAELARKLLKTSTFNGRSNQFLVKRL